MPLKSWVENDLKDNIFDRLSKDSYSQNFIDKKFITDVLNNKLNIPSEKRAKILWNMYCLEVWKDNL